MANRLTATMVVDLQDKTGAKTTAILGNMDKLKRAERDLKLAEGGFRLSNRDRLQERVILEKQRSVEERQASISRWAARGAAATAAVGLGAAKAYSDYASLERRINRIVINADKGTDAIQPTIDRLRKVSNDTAMPFQDVVDGLDSLIAAGRSMDDAMSFLPSVTMTAQASGAAVDDMAKSADALGNALKIDPSQMQKAFDILVASGKSGKFELKDMARELPSLTPAFAALGYSGTDGLRKLAAMLQVVRTQTGTSSEAATNLGNVFQKMYSEETAKNFAKMGVDITATLDKAKKDGKDILEVFMDATQAATKGDLSKLTLLFTDSQMQQGMRALITQRDLLKQFTNELKNVDGSSLKDFNRVADDSLSKIQRLSNNWEIFSQKVGSKVAFVANPTLEYLNNGMDKISAQDAALDDMGIGVTDVKKYGNIYAEYIKKYKEANPNASALDLLPTNPDGTASKVQQSFEDDLARLGRGEIKSILDRLNNEIYRNEPLLGASAPSGQWPPSVVPQPRPLPDPDSLGASPQSPHEYVRTPTPRPTAEQMKEEARRRGIIDGQSKQGKYPSHGIYDAPPSDYNVHPMLEGPSRLSPNMQFPDASFWDGFKRFMLGAAADPNFNAKDHFGIQTKAAGDNGPQPVTLSGTPSVTITNPPPRPNVNVQMSVTIHEAQNADAVARQLGQAVRNEMNGLQAATNDSGL